MRRREEKVELKERGKRPVKGLLGIEIHPFIQRTCGAATTTKAHPAELEEEGKEEEEEEKEEEDDDEERWQE